MSGGELRRIFRVALAIRILAAAFAANTPCHADECWYVELAHALRAGLGVLPERGHVWPPGYLLFLAALDSPWLVRMAQAVISAATIFPAAALARRGFGDREARATAWILALSPTLIAFSHYFWPETLHLLPFATAIALLLALRRRCARGEPGSAIAIAAGVAFGLACLTKAVHFHFLAAAVVWLWLEGTDRRRALRAAALVVVATVLTVLPWSLYASNRYERVVVLEATLGVNLWRGNNTFAPFNADLGPRRALAGGSAPCDDPNPIDRDRCNTIRSTGFIVRHPVLFLRHAVTKMADLWSPTSFLVRHLRLGHYGSMPRALVEAIVACDVAWWLVIALGATLGIVLPVRDPGGREDARALRDLVLLLIAYTCFVSVVTFGMSRFRVPLYPFLAIFAARAWTERARLAELRSDAWRLAVVGCVVAGLATISFVRVSSVWPHAG